MNQEPMTLSDRLSDCLPKVGEPEAQFCVVDTADLRAALDELDTLRSQLAHWKTFSIHAENEHAAWKKTCIEIDEELRALRGTAPFTDTARMALLWVLWHHQGGSSPVGQPLRFALGMDAHERLNEHQVKEAQQWATLTRSTTAEFHAARGAKDAEIANLREALRRLREWGGIAGKNYSATVAFDVAAWLDAGGNGPLPEAPEYARIKPAPKPQADPPAA